MKLVEHLVERVFRNGIEVGAEQVAERGAPQPGRHGVFGGGRDQAIEHHRAGEPQHRCRQAAVAQDAVEFEAVPELMADMNRAGLAVALGGDARRIDFDQRAAVGRQWRRRRRMLLAAALFVAAPRPHPINDVGDFAVIGVEQMALTEEGVLGARIRSTPRAAAGSDRRANKSSSVAVPWRCGLTRPARNWCRSCRGRTESICGCTCPTIQHKTACETNKYSFILVTILKMRAFRAGPLKQNQRLASRPQADAAVKSLCKGGSWVS